jgi:hypothetical protein
MKTGADLPECLVNHILSYRPTHPVARLVQNPDIHTCYRMTEYWTNVWDMCYDFGQTTKDILSLIERRDQVVEALNFDEAFTINVEIVEMMLEHDKNMKTAHNLLDSVLCGDVSDPRKEFDLSAGSLSFVSRFEYDLVCVESLLLHSSQLKKKWASLLDRFSQCELLSIFNSPLREMSVEMRLSV